MIFEIFSGKNLTKFKKKNLYFFTWYKKVAKNIEVHFLKITFIFSF